MNTISFIAFLLGINGTPPATPTHAEHDRPSTVKEANTPSTTPGKPKGGPGGDGEGRGGWDRN